MTSESVGQRKGRIFYGYYLLAVTFLFLVLFNGAGVFAFSLFVRPLEASLGWGRGQVMAGFTVFYAMVGIASPVVGRFVDRYGARPVIPVGALVMGLGFVLVSQMSRLHLFYLGYVIIGTGAAAMGPVPCSAVISNWFKRKRGTALGLMSAGIGAGGVMAPLIGYVLAHYDWRTAYLSLAAVLVAVTVPMSLALIRTRPAEMGLYPDGGNAPEEGADELTRAADERNSFTLRQSLRTPAFWLIGSSFGFTAFGSMGALQASVPFLEDIGYPTTTAASALGGIGFGSAVGKILFGRLCDLMKANRAFAIGIALLLAGVLILLTVDAGSPLSLIWIYALVLGLGAGAWLPTLSVLTSSYYGLVHYGTVFGALSLCLSLGTATGPLFSGMMHDATDAFRGAFVTFAVLLAIALPTIIVARKPSRPLQ